MISKNWAKSLYNPERKIENSEKCYWSTEYETIIHKFDLGSTICRCGVIKNERPEFKPKFNR